MPAENRRIVGPEISQPVALRQRKRHPKPLMNGDSLRQDGRKVNELRSVFIRSGVVSSARGSSYIEMQRTKVTCAVYGPRESSKQQEFSQKGKLTCEFKFAPFSCPQRRHYIQDSEEKEFSSFIVQALEPALCLDKFPKAQVDIFITVIENDGNALSAGVLCASVALGEAGVEMYDLVSSCSLVQKGVTSIMDPTFEESASSEVDGKITVAFLPTMNVISGVLQDGELNHDQAIKAVKCCMEGSVRVCPVLQECLVQTVKQSVKSKQ
ncbi:exosome complex component MTR3-like isoform X1 [Acropora muricata]|uniref:exosome complex component MTR3-like isoform X1 n=2 Tax=Acropora millepora TaxID=45264 RepID=UPI0010FC941F|nr:exosome complex component MTR3-like isoform X1 [Acropora millepora]